MIDVEVTPKEDGQFEGRVLTYRAAGMLTRRSASGSVFRVDQRFPMTAVGLYQLTRACRELQFDIRTKTSDVPSCKGERLWEAK